MEFVHVFYTIVDNHLIAADHEQVVRLLVSRVAGKKPEKGKTLADIEAYIAAMKKCDDVAGDAAPHLRWFIEPFGYAAVARAADGGRRQRGKDLLKILEGQGFTAIQGLGGHVTFSTGDHEILHRTFIYAPPVAGLAAGQKYPKAANMLEFPNVEKTGELLPQTWIPRKAATYVTFKWKLQQAFWASEGLVDDVVGAKGSFRDVLKALKLDPAGPQIDVEKDLVANLSERATFVTDYKLPITPKSERWMGAVELLEDKEAIVKTLVDKAMEHDPDAKRREFEGHVIWEIINEDEDDGLEDIEIGGPGGFAPLPAEDDDDEEKEKPLLPNSAVTVAHGHLIVASHIDFVIDMLRDADAADKLATAADYQVVSEALAKLGSDKDSFRVFTRTDEATRPTYELIRQGKMPESETLLGKLLNKMLGPDEEGVLREQQIDGKKMPAYPIVRRHLGPSGLFVRSEEEGWFATGCLLTKENKVK